MADTRIPSGWAETTVGEVVEAYGTVDPQVQPDKEFAYIDIGAINNKTNKIEAPKTFRGKDAPSRARRVVRHQDVLFSTVRTYLKNVAMVPAEMDGHLTSTGIAVLRPSAAVDPVFLFRTVLYDEFIDRISGEMDGTLYPAVRDADVLASPLVLPPLNEQRRIVAKIEELTDRSRRAREALDAVPALLDRFRQSVLAAAFRGDLTAEWRAKNPDVEPASGQLRRIRESREQAWFNGKGRRPYPSPIEVTLSSDWDSDFAELGWTCASLDALTDPSRGITYGIVQTGAPTPGGVPTVRCGDIRDFRIELSGLKQVSATIEQQYQRTRLQGGEVLIAIRGTVGATAVVTDELVGSNISREVAMLPLLPGVHPRFLMYLLASPIAQQLLGDQIKGVAQSGVNIGDLKNLVIPLPPFREQVAIVHSVEQLFGAFRGIETYYQGAMAGLSRLDQSILAKAFCGELVPQDPNDEPASVLLERIRSERAEAVVPKARRGRKPRELSEA